MMLEKELDMSETALCTLRASARRKQAVSECKKAELSNTQRNANISCATKIALQFFMEPEIFKGNFLVHAQEHALGFSLAVLDTAKELVREAGAIMLRERRVDLKIDIKQDNSIVTDVDKEISEFLTSRLLESFPGYGVLSEESAEDDQRPLHRLCWVIDPLDGTIDYVRGGNNFGAMIGLLDNYVPVLGVTYQPVKNELVYAVKGSGAYITDGNAYKQLKVSDSSGVSVLVSRFRKIPELEQMLAMIKPTRTTNMSTSFKSIEVAKGNATLFLSPKAVTMNLWDLCAPAVILEEAGGRISDIYGNKIDYAGNLQNQNGVIASNSIIHDYVINKIAELDSGGC